MRSNLKIYILVAVMVLIALAIYFLSYGQPMKNSSSEASNVSPRILSEEKSKKYELAKEISTPDGFINTGSNPISISELIGKQVILVDFWTYSCINCQRTTPYLNSWHAKYKDKGLVIIGMHTPEFEFEKDYGNVEKAVKKFQIQYPVVLDNDYSTWTAYKNRYWPRKYLIDIDGYIIYDHIGEGKYEETEQKIQQALTERMNILAEAGKINEPLTKEVSLQSLPESPETYFGSTRNEFLGNAKTGVLGLQKNLSIPSQIDSNTLYLSGDWNLESQFAQNASAIAGIAYTYKAKDVFFVAEAEEEAMVEVLLDGKPIITGMGEDITKTADGRTILKVKEARLYKIIQDINLETHHLEFIIRKPGLKAFTFTFG